MKTNSKISSKYRQNIICFDLETTDVNIYKAEVLQCAVIDNNHKVLFNQYMKPIEATEWVNAMQKNKITPEMVKNCRTIEDYKDELIKIFDSADIIISYNGDNYDIPILQRLLGVKFKAKTVDVMRHFTKEFSLYNHFQYRFKLEKACELLGVPLTNAHNALADATATLDLFNRMAEESRKYKLDIIYKFENDIEIYGEENKVAYENQGHEVVEELYYKDGHRIDKPTDMRLFARRNFTKY